MPGRTVSASGYRYGFNGQEKDNEIAGEATDYTATFWEYDSRIGKRWNVDPVVKSWESSYATFGNNPILNVDPNGDKEYDSKRDYRKATGNKKLGKGDWLITDRKGNTDVWKNANTYNLQQEKGYNEYTSIDQRADFYGWFQTASDAKGSKTKWAGAASEVASGISMLTKSWVKSMGYSNDDAAQFAEIGNRMIFEDVFPKLKGLYNGSPLAGKDAYKWDANALSQEQNLIQPLYENTPAFGLLSAAAKQRLAFSSWVAPVRPFPANGNLMNVNERWQYGMLNMGYKVQTSNMPDPGTNYKSYYDYKAQQYIVSPQYQKLRQSGAGGSW